MGEGVDTDLPVTIPAVVGVPAATVALVASDEVQGEVEAAVPDPVKFTEASTHTLTAIEGVIEGKAFIVMVLVAIQPLLSV